MLQATLNNGVIMPLVGLGTFQANSEEAKLAVSWALDAGYRRIDTAAIYRNEAAIGEALQLQQQKEERGKKIKREDIFITSKVPPTLLSFDGATQSCLSSLVDLKTNYLDLLLLHWPAKSGIKKESAEHFAYRKSAWEALETLYAQGKCRAIGVSNYTVQHLEQMEAYTRIKPAVNQVECHPCLQQDALRKYCNAKGILVEAYTSLGQGQLLEDPVVAEVARKYKRSPAQILLRWGLQHNLAVIPKSVTKERIIANYNLFDFAIRDDDLAALDTLERNLHYCWDPSDIP